MITYNNKTIAIPYPLRFREAIFLLGIALLSSALLFCIFYLSNSYEALQHWYLRLNDCFYKSDEWPVRFFTPATKTAGDRLAIAGMLVAASGIMLLVRHWRWHGKWERGRSLHIGTSNAMWYAGVAVIAIVAGVWEWRIMPPAYDEIFSAVNCAEMHPFQTMSYYMLPNNHLLFNLANRLLLGWHGDFVQSGRVLSLIAYIGVLVCAFRWLAKLMNNQLYAFIALLPVAFQFVTWGFGAMARGYEWQLLCGWMAFTSLLRIAADGNRTAINTNVVFNLIGFLLLPSYFYFYAAQLLFAGALLLYKRGASVNYWLRQLVVVIGAFLFYLPAFCFSGVGAFAANKYVQPVAHSLAGFLPDFIALSKNFISYCFSDLVSDGTVMSYVLIATPLLLLLTKNNKNRLIAGFYLCMWVGYILCSLVIRHTPFHRTMIIQFSITMACTVYTLYYLTGIIVEMIRNKQVSYAARIVAFVMPVLLFSAYLKQYDRNHVNFGLYANDVNGIYQAHLNDIAQLPPGSSIAFSTESFYFYYHCRKMHYRTSRCAIGNEDYYIKRTEEQLPGRMVATYTFLAKGCQDYEFYKRK